MEKFTKQKLIFTLILLAGFLFGMSPGLRAQSGSLDILASGPYSVVLKVDTTLSTGYRVDYKVGAEAYSPISEFTDTTVRADGFVYLLHDGLTKNTEYTYQLTPFDAVGDGTPVEATVTTEDSVLWVDMNFDEDFEGKVANTVNGRLDTMYNASIVQEGVFDGAIKFELKEIIPGVEYENSYVFLDSALWDVFNQEVDAGQRWFARDYTELTYMFWFKNDQPATASDEGATVAMFGDQAASGVTIYDDSLMFASGAKFGSDNFSSYVSHPYYDSTWTHFAMVFKNGVSDIYLNGDKVMTHSSEGNYFHSRLSTRMSDHWSKSMIGAGYWWNRAMQGIYGTYGDKAFHNQFNGLMDEFKVLSYAVPESFIQAEVAAALPEPATISQKATGPSSIVVVADAVGADTLMFQIQEGTGDLTELIPANKVVQQDVAYYLIDGLTEDTEYTVKVWGENGIGAGDPGMLTLTTPAKEKWVELSFENVANGRVENLINGRTDSLVNAEAIATGIDALGNAVEFAEVEIIPGVEYEYSYIFLDSTFHDVFNGLGDPNQTNWKVRDYTEASYSFWFKDNDPEGSSTNGAALAMFGDQLSTGVTIYNDSIYLGSGAKFGGNNLFVNDGSPFDNTGEWNHVAVTYKNGMIKLYLNGEVVITLDEASSGYFWNRFSLRANDHWAKNMMGAAYWWNRALHGIYNTYGDREFHNQFNGLMDEFQVFSYELTEQEVLDMVTSILPGPADASLAAKGPNSVVIKANAVDADTIRFTSKAGTADPIDAEPTMTVTQNDEDYYLFDGLSEDTDYVFTAISVGDAGEGAPAEVAFSTPAKEMMVHLDFESATDGKVQDAVTGNSDSLIFVEIVPSGCDDIGNAAQFTETMVGPELVGSIIFLDNTLGSYMDMVYNAGNQWKGIDFTESSYSFWMKVGDWTKATEDGVALTVFGDQFGNGVGLYNDSIWVTSGGKFGGTNISSKAGYPFTDTNLVHVAYTFKNGITELYVSGQKVITMDDTENYFWSRYSTRNDHWASSSMGGGYWWNRPMNSLTDENFGDQMYHMLFDGLMDEFKVFSYALTGQEISDMSEGLCPAVGVEENLVSALKVYPNPATDKVYFGKELSGKIQVLDMTGKVLIDRTLNFENQLDISSLNAGIYMLKFNNEERTYISNLIIK